MTFLKAISLLFCGTLKRTDRIEKSNRRFQRTGYSESETLSSPKRTTYSVVIHKNDQMKILIIYSHPSKLSYTYEILDQLKLNFENEKLDYEISDLYEMNFQTDMSEEEYEREGLINLDLPIPDDVKKEHRKIEEADCILFVYPVWWSDCPAKLKGWFDRVYSVGYAYGYDESGNKMQTMKTIPYGAVICTAGHPNEFLDETGIAESMRNVMLDDRLGKRFYEKEMIILGGTLNKEEVRDKHSRIIDKIGSRIRKKLHTN